MSTTEQVLAIVESVPPGRVTTYGSIADVVEGASARSVGHALRTDGHGVPWWRVVTAGGRPAPGAEAAAHERYLEEGTPLIAFGDGVYTVDLAAATWHVEADGPP
ncbi:MGMT family protein [Actinomycetospora atypica]|uniref:MGMT family protein n=1 Tax=Actinomycetospora atypica TaxID=1290095 RepID=A0ABV9YV04_9PSEU